jgi:predicted O-methyltransferase YrrM
MANVAKEYGGKINTIKYNEQLAKQTIKNVKHADVAELIEVIIRDAKEIIPTLKESLNLVFQDVGDKTLHPVLLENLITLLKPDGVFLAEYSLLSAREMNVSKYEDFYQVKWIESLEEFNKLIAHCSYLSSTILPIGDGLTIGIKIG